MFCHTMVAKKKKDILLPFSTDLLIVLEMTGIPDRYDSK